MFEILVIFVTIVTYANLFQQQKVVFMVIIVQITFANSKNGQVT